MTEIIQELPEDATYEKIMRELAFERMVERWLVDSRTGRVISNEEMARGFEHGSRNKMDGLGRAVAQRHTRLYSAGRPCCR